MPSDVFFLAMLAGGLGGIAVGWVAAHYLSKQLGCAHHRKVLMCADCGRLLTSAEALAAQDQTDSDK